MTPTRPHPLQTLLYEALAEPIGLLIQTDNPGLLLRKLYQRRVKANDPALATLQFRNWPGGQGQIAIVKETIQLPASPLLEQQEEEEHETDQ